MLKQLNSILMLSKNLPVSALNTQREQVDFSAFSLASGRQALGYREIKRKIWLYLI
jgi:hypothetical protein